MEIQAQLGMEEKEKQSELVGAEESQRLVTCKTCPWVTAVYCPSSHL
jgi:hypothetical protein